MSPGHEQSKAVVDEKASAQPERGPEPQVEIIGQSRSRDKVEETERGYASLSEEGETEESETPPLPEGEEPPPLPNEAPPDDGWRPLWDNNAQAYYFHNHFTGATQWENPRVPESIAQPSPPGVDPAKARELVMEPLVRPHGGYNPAVHGDYDPAASYALEAAAQAEAAAQPQLPPGAVDSAATYAATGQFNRFTGKWQAADKGPETHNDESKSKRQMNAFFDVDAAANVHNGRSLKAERQGKKLSKTELKAFKEKRKGKKEEKRRAWLLD